MDQEAIIDAVWGYGAPYNYPVDWRDGSSILGDFNHSGRFRRSYVSHYLSSQAEWVSPERTSTSQRIMWVRGNTFPGKVTEVAHDVL